MSASTLAVKDSTCRCSVMTWFWSASQARARSSSASSMSARSLAHTEALEAA